MLIDKYLYDINTEITFYRNDTNRIHFETNSRIELNYSDLQSSQANLGYNPLVYGFNGIVYMKINNTYKYQWHCSASPI